MAVILHVATTLHGGGAEAVLSRLVRGDDANTHFVVGLAPGDSPDLVEYGVRTSSLGIRRQAIPIAPLLRLVRLIREVKPDVVQTWMYHADLLGGLAAKMAGGAPVVWGIHNANLDVRVIRRRTRFIAGACAFLSHRIPARIVSCSRRAAHLHGELGYASELMRVIPNGCDLDRFARDVDGRRRIRRELGVGDTTLLFGMVARFDPQKDHANLIAALCRLDSKLETDWRCVLVGEGIDARDGDIARLVDGGGLSGRVFLCGARADMPAVFSAIDVHVLSSAGEAFPNVVAEAMACGSPCIVTDVGDAPVIVGETGWVVPARDSDALAGAMITATEYACDPDSWRLRQEAARQRIASEFSLEQMIRSYREVWLDVDPKPRADFLATPSHVKGVSIPISSVRPSNEIFDEARPASRMPDSRDGGGRRTAWMR